MLLKIPSKFEIFKQKVGKVKINVQQLVEMRG